MRFEYRYHNNASPIIQMMIEMDLLNNSLETFGDHVAYYMTTKSIMVITVTLIGTKTNTYTKEQSDHFEIPANTLDYLQILLSYFNSVHWEPSENI